MKKLSLILTAILTLSLVACNDSAPAPKEEPKSDSNVTKAHATVPKGSDGLTLEQHNVKHRVEGDKSGAIKHLYIIAPESGQVILYSTVDGKVTSSGKRLTPKTVAATDGQYVDSNHQGFPIDIGGRTVYTPEVLEDDGTYGNSEPYIYWWDVRGVYHQHFFTGGQIIHVADQPITVKNVIINLEVQPTPSK